MKIKKLTIHNIASIEDATIDFSAKPLSDTDIFLITGTTGAGKTTILDAICLALFNTTPRLSKTMRSKIGANADDLTATDPRNFMRLNTGEAKVVLTFDGTDGNQYQAEWYVQRGKNKKATTRMDNVVWTLDNLTTGHRTSGAKQGAYNDVERDMTQAIGMDFEQFCRTTMLAQGQFTEFLSSQEAEKAVILEKITDTEIYSRLGQQIYTILQEKEKAYKEEKEKIDQITLLTDEQIEEVNKQIESINTQIGELDTKDKDIQSRIDWLKTQENDAKAVKDAQDKYHELDTKIKGDDFRQSKQRLQNWTDTSEVRGHLTEASKAKKEITTQEGIIAGLKAMYVRCINGKAWAEQQLDTLNHALETIENDLNQQAEYQSLYAKAQTISGELKQWDNFTKEIAQLKNTLQKEQQEEIKHTDEEKKAKQDFDNKEQSVNDLQKQIDDAKKQLPDLDTLYRQKSDVESIARLKDEITQKATQKTDTEKRLSDDALQLREKKEQLEKEEKELHKQQEAMDKRKDTVEKWARDIRAKLTVGCQCPVCLQTLQSPLPDEAEIDSEFKTLKEGVDKQQEVVNGLKDSINTLSAQQSTEQNNLTQIEGGISQKQTELQNKIQACTWADRQLLETQSADDLRKTMLSGIADKIRAGEGQKKSIGDQEADLRKLQKEKDNALGILTQKQKSLAETKAKIEKTQQSLKDNDENKTVLTQTLSGYQLGVLPYGIDWQKEPIAFADCLIKSAGAYDKLGKEKSEKESGRDKYQTMLNTLPAMPENLPAEWVALTANPAENKQLSKDCSNLQTEFATANSKLTDATEKCHSHQAEVEQYLAEHTQFTQAYLGELNGLSQQEYNAENQKIIQAIEQYENADKNLQKAQAEQQQHLQQKPQTALDTDTEKGLQQQQTENRAMHDKCVEDKTLRQKQLDDNEENKNKKGDTTRLKQLAADVTKWNIFKDIADKEGKTFRNVAQSMILSSLLDTANKHLHRLEPRYTLRVVENSLNLKLEDAYQGFSTRSTGTISGGESFLVSLSLALALADFGQNLGVSTLFIDEGFGTLSGTPLNNAINLLKSLHSQNGTQVGIISHREEIKEKIDVQIQVSPIGNAAASKVEVVNAMV